MIKLGISAFYHDSAACIIKGNQVLVAAEEERFTGIKHDSSFPIQAISWCFKQTKFKIEDIDIVYWYEDPIVKHDRVTKIFDKRWFKTFFLRRKYNKQRKENDPAKLLMDLGYRGKIHYIPHHQSHAKFAYFTSPFKESAILTIDGVGEWETVTVSRAVGNEINKIKTIEFPNSLGMLYSTITAYLGFKPNEGEYKVMGLAPYGNPKNRFRDKLDKLFSKRTTNKFWLDQKYFTWEYSDKIMFNKNLCRLLDLEPRLPEEPIRQDHKDLAYALQSLYNREFSKLVVLAKNITASNNLCLSGGCAYNGVANNLAYSKFKSVHIPFSPSDAGSAIGACLTSHIKLNPYLGPEYKNEDITKLLYDEDIRKKVRFINDSYANIVTKVAQKLHDNKVVAWFQGKMEFGARALGNRSILANPLDPNMRDKLNRVIKKREGFRPFAPSVIEEKAKDYFNINEPIPYMNQVVQAKTDYFPSATHVDGTSRVQTVTRQQNPRYYQLLKEFEKISGHPVLLNTSFNLKDQTITRTPRQAIERFVHSDIDYLVINNIVILKN
tara:strand:- start:524 stop:2176 length:1653 start_codon:yes stop_codon:yes gene_type:complete